MVQTESAAYTRHPLSEIWGSIPDDDTRALREDIEKYGVVDPVIWLYEGKVLDGWNRYTCYNVARLRNPQIQPLEFREYTGDDPWGFTVSKNRHRRHLTAAQILTILADGHKLAGVGNPQFRNASELENPLKSTDLAEQAGVSTRTVDDWRVGYEGGYAEEMRSGELSAHAAAEKVRNERKDETESDSWDNGWPEPEDDEYDYDNAQDTTQEAPPVDDEWAIPKQKRTPASIDNLEDRINVLESEMDALRRENDNLKDRNRFLEAESRPDSSREAAFNDFIEEKRVLAASAAHWKALHAEERQRANSLDRLVKKYKSVYGDV